MTIEENAEVYTPKEIKRMKKVWKKLNKKNEVMLDKFYEICKFIVCLCGTVIMVLMTISMVAVLLK